MKSLTPICIFALMLAGCTANEKSIYRNKTLPKEKPSVQSLDAKQRLMIMVPVQEYNSTTVTETDTATETTTTSSSADGSSVTRSTSRTTTIPAASTTAEGEKPKRVTEARTTTHLRFCAEPSPDVFSVYAGSLAANLDLKKSASPADLALGAGLGVTTSEQGSTIARTQTINLLKELMYRTCERYASGGIGQLELAVQSVRDQRVIIAALAIEQLTGTVMPKPTIIGAAGTAGTGADAAGAVMAIDKRTTEKATADKALATAQDNLSKANGDSGLCKDKKDRPEGAADPTPAQETACKDAKDGVDKATKDAALAKTNLDLLVKASEIGGPIANVAATLFAAKGEGGVEQANAVSIQAVTTAVENIVKANYDASELELLCVKAFDPGAGSPPITALVEQCSKYFSAKIALAEARAALAEATAEKDRAAIIQQKMDILEDIGTKRCKIFWALPQDRQTELVAKAKQTFPGSSKSVDRAISAGKNCALNGAFLLLTENVQQLLAGEKP